MWVVEERISIRNRARNVNRGSRDSRWEAGPWEEIFGPTNQRDAESVALAMQYREGDVRCDTRIRFVSSN